MIEKVLEWRDQVDQDHGVAYDARPVRVKPGGVGEEYRCIKDGSDGDEKEQMPHA